MEVVIDEKTHRLQAGEMAFIPPGIPHAAGNGGLVPARFIEIYAPAGGLSPLRAGQENL